MQAWEYNEFLVPFGDHRDRAVMLKALNDLGAQGWEVLATKDVVYPLTKNGAHLMQDGVRVLAKRAVPSQPPPKEPKKPSL